MSRTLPTSDSGPTRTFDRRSVLRLAAGLTGGAAVGPMLAACSPPVGRAGPLAGVSEAPSTGLVSDSITVLIEGGDPASEPAMQQVYDDFRTLHPGIGWDLRALPGLGPEFDRLARAAIASGEPVGLVMLDGLFVRAWTRDGLLADLGADPHMAATLARVPEAFHLGGLDGSTRAFPLALSRGVHTTGLYYNKALLDRAGLGPPTTISDLRSMVQPLAALGVAPLVHPAGDVPFDPLLVMWLLPMIAGRSRDPLAFVEDTVRGAVGYDGPEWIEAFEAIADLSTSGILLEGSGAVDYAATQQLFLQGRAAMTYNGSWMLPQLEAGTPTVPFDLHVAPLPLVDGASRAHSILAWTGFAIPAGSSSNADSVIAFLEFASRPEVDRAVVEASQAYSPLAGSNAAIHDSVAREFLPMLADAITPLNWLWEPEIDAEMGDQVRALVQGETDATSAGRAIEAVARDLRAAGRSYYP